MYSFSLFPGLAKPAESFEDYQSDVNDDYDEGESEQKENPKSNAVNNQQINEPAFFRYANYNETVKAGETATLKCIVENLGGK